MKRVFMINENGDVFEPVMRQLDGSEITLEGDQFSFTLGSGWAQKTIVINDWFGGRLYDRVKAVAAAADAMFAALTD